MLLCRTFLFPTFPQAVAPLEQSLAGAIKATDVPSMTHTAPEAAAAAASEAAFSNKNAHIDIMGDAKAAAADSGAVCVIDGTFVALVLPARLCSNGALACGKVGNRKVLQSSTTC